MLASIALGGFQCSDHLPKISPAIFPGLWTPKGLRSEHPGKSPNKTDVCAESPARGFSDNSIPIIYKKRCFTGLSPPFKRTPKNRRECAPRRGPLQFGRAGGSLFPGIKSLHHRGNHAETVSRVPVARCEP